MKMIIKVDDKYGELLEWENPRNRYLCPLCGWANDPNVYAMKKVGKRYYHEICLRKALRFFLNRYDFKLSYKGLHPVFCKKKVRKETVLSDEELYDLFKMMD